MPDYSISESGDIRLNLVKRKVRCKTCDNIVALNGGRSLLLKGFVLMDYEGDAVMVKCHKCKSLNVVKVNPDPPK